MSETPVQPDAQPLASPSKPTVTYEDFARLDLRVAKVVSAEPHPNADRLLRLQVDDGSDTPRQICAGIREHCQPEDLVGRLIVIVANLAPRTIRGEESRGMLLAASQPGEGESRRVVVLSPSADVAPGSVVS